MYRQQVTRSKCEPRHADRDGHVATVSRGDTTEREPEDQERAHEDEVVEPPPFDPDPNLVSFLERGRNDDPKRVWGPTRNVSR